MMSVVVGLVLIAGAVLLVTHQSGSISAESRAFEESTSLDLFLDSAETHARWQLQQHACIGYAPFTHTIGSNSYAVAYQPGAGSPVTITVDGSLGNLSGVRVLEQARAYDAVETTTLVSTVTAYVRENDGSSNNGNHKDVHVGKASGDRRRGLVQFNIASLPAGAVVERATLRVYVNDEGETGGDVVSIRRVTRWWSEDEVTWDEARSGTDWSSPGGDYHWAEHGQLTTGTLGWQEADVTDLVRGWQTGAYSNHGMIFMADNPSGSKEFKFYTEDHPENLELIVEHKCECGGTCSVNAFVSCDANFRANTEGTPFAPGATAAMTGIAAVPGNITIMGAAFGADGGYIVPDGNNLEAFHADGTSAGTCNVSGTISGGVAGLGYALRGPYQGQLVVLEDAASPTLHLIGEACSVDQTLNVTGSALINPTGVSYLTLDAGHAYEDHFALTDSSGNIEFVSAVGAVVGTASIDFPATQVSGLAHVYNQDRLLLLNNGTDEVYNVDFAGGVRDRYDYTRFGSDTPQGLAVDTFSCEHVLPSTAADEMTRLARTDLSAEPIAHWRFDELTGNVAVDSVGSHDATLGGGGTWEPTAGAVQGTLLINAPNEGGVVAENAALNMASSMTVVGWIKASTSSSGTKAIVSRYDDSFDHNYKLGLVDMEPSFTVYNGSTHTLTASTTLNAGEWYHLAGVYDSTTSRARLYLNGNLLLSAAVTAPLLATPGNFNIGQTYYGGYVADGRIDDVMLFDSALEEEDIQRLVAESKEPLGTYTPPGGGSTLGCTSNTYADEFSDTSWFSWPGSTGTYSWTGGWSEINDSGSPVSGDVRKENTRIYGTRSARVFGPSKGLQRSADLSPFGLAVVRFDYTRENLESNDEIIVSAGNSGGAVELGRIVGETGVFDSQADPQSGEFTIPEHLLTNDAYVQIVNSSTLSSGEGAYIDNFVIEGCPP